jgi:hypothetical protein
MSDAEQTCLRATRLFALAIKAREDGNSDYANELTKLASEAFDHEPPARSRQTRQLGFVI